MVDDSADLTTALHHVLWIGGPPDSGKTTIAERIAERYGLQTYHFDRYELAHFARADAEQHPALYAAHPDRMTTEERWLSQSPEEMARSTIACWTERFAMAIDDIRAMTREPIIVAEGPGFFPECIQPLISDVHQAVWLVPAEPFKRASAAARSKPGNRHETSDPERATRNLIDRDLLMGEHVWRQARNLGLTAFEIDSSRSLDHVAGLVEAHFAQLLPAANSIGT